MSSCFMSLNYFLFSKNSDSSFNDVIIALLWLLERLISTFIDMMYFEIVSAFSLDNRVFR